MTRDRNRLPAFLKRCFWDVPFRQLDLQQVSAFVIERILEYGDPQAVRWMQDRFAPEAIRETVKRARGLSARSANFWARHYRVERRHVRCLSTSFQRRRAQHWFV